MSRKISAWVACFLVTLWVASELFQCVYVVHVRVDPYVAAVCACRLTFLLRQDDRVCFIVVGRIAVFIAGNAWLLLFLVLRGARGQCVLQWLQMTFVMAIPVD